MRKVNDTADVIGEVYYDPSSKTGLRWKTDRVSGKGAVQRAAGSEAGSQHPTGYANLAFGGKSYAAHRVVWHLCVGPIPQAMEVDHIDGNKLNNDIRNLRLVTRNGNMRNRGKNLNNSSGVTGVGLYSPHGCPAWTARWRENGAARSKNFSVGKYGYDAAKSMAVEHRERKIRELNAAGAGYTERHGNGNS